MPDLIDLPRIGFIGAGRLGTALAWCLARHASSVVAVASRGRASAERLAAGIAGCRVTDAQALVDACDLVFITTPDAQIAPTAAALRWRPGMAVVHCSGATGLDALAPARAGGTWVGGLHPLQSFSDPVSGAATLPGCTLTLEAEEPLLAHLQQLAADLGCPVNTLPPGHRAAYHAAAGYASQFVHVLMREAAAIWQTWGGTEAQALQALLPLLRGTADSMQRSGIAGGMPGPVSRGDVASVAAHLEALHRIDVDSAALYRALCLRSLPLAVERGGLDPLSADRLLALLDPARSLPAVGLDAASARLFGPTRSRVDAQPLRRHAAPHAVSGKSKKDIP